MCDLVLLSHSRGRSTRYSNGLDDFSVTIPRGYKDFHVNSFSPCRARVWNFLPAECFPLTYDLNGFKSRVNRHIFGFPLNTFPIYFSFFFFCFL